MKISSRLFPILRRATAVTTIILLVCFLAAALASSRAAAQSDSVEDLWIDLRIGPPLISLFNEMARSDDIARVEHPSQFEQLAGIEGGRKLVIFKSVAEAEALLPDMTGDIDVIGYNLEHGQTTPDEEKADPVGSIRQMRELADAHGLDLAFGPDHDFALSHGVEMAPFVDIFVLQIQRQQTNPRTVAAFVEPIVPQLREANPEVAISVQIRTEGDVQDIIDLVAGLDAELDGLSILTSPETVDVAEEMVFALRPEASTSSQGLGQNTTIIIVAVVALILLAGVVIYRRNRAAK